MNDASSEAKKEIADATSSGTPTLPRGCFAACATKNWNENMLQLNILHTFSTTEVKNKLSDNYKTVRRTNIHVDKTLSNK